MYSNIRLTSSVIITAVTCPVISGEKQSTLCGTPHKSLSGCRVRAAHGGSLSTPAASLLGARPRLTLSATGKQRSRSSRPPQRQALGDGFYSAWLGWRQHLRPALTSPSPGPAVPSAGAAPLAARPLPPRPAPAANGRRAPSEAPRARSAVAMARREAAANQEAGR